MIMGVKSSTAWETELSRNLYFFGNDGERHGAAQLPNWVNQPHKADRDPEWDLDVCPPGPNLHQVNLVSWIGSGFPEFVENPRFVFERPLGNLPFLDIVRIARNLLLLSDKAKSVLEPIDPSAFAIHATDVLLWDGTIGPKYWLCDVVRFLDALDEDRSPSVSIKTVEYGPERPLPPGASRILRIAHHSLSGDEVFKAAIVGKHHIFRECHQTWQIFFDEEVASAMRSANLTGVRPALLGVIDGH